MTGSEGDAATSLSSTRSTDAAARQSPVSVVAGHAPSFASHLGGRGGAVGADTAAPSSTPPTTSLRTRVADWQVWTLPTRAVLYIGSVELVVAFAIIAQSLTWPQITSADMSLCAVLIVGTCVHLRASRRQEERRRDASPDGPHLDLTSSWTVPAALLLPPLLAVAVAVAVRSALWPIRRRAAHRFLLGSAAVLASVTTTSWLVHASRVDLLGRRDLPALAVASAAVAAYGLVNAVLIGAAKALSQTPAAWRGSFGDRRLNHHAALALAAALVAALVWAFAPPAARVLEAVVGTWGLVVLDRHLRDHAIVQDRAERDGKTGLYRCDEWEKRAREALRTRNSPRPVWAVAMIDVDYFKRINDTAGHPAGDAVLRGIAATIAAHVRRSDLAGRFGGEEFVLLLGGRSTPEKATRRLRQRMDDLRAAIETTTFDIRNNNGQPEKRQVTVSIGLAVMAGPVDLGAAVSAADDAVLRAKGLGRNTVVIA